jgi:hypothetical protein
MALADKLGQSYIQVKEDLKYKTITVSNGEKNFDLSVRIPLKKEMEQMIEDISNPTKERVDDLYKKLSAGIQKSIDNGGEKFLEAINAEQQVITVTDDDIVFDGTSIRQLATFTIMNELKIEKYFALLKSDISEPVNESYEKLTDELSESLIKAVILEIEKVIKPNYEDVKKN